ncbi:MAG: PH domain-containing protein [Patescibacteria group bacterium]
MSNVRRYATILAMFHIEDVLQLKDREDVRHITRRHILTMLPGLVLALILIVIPFFLMFPMFSWGIFGVILFFIAVLLGIGVAIRTLLLWDADILIVTTLRLVDVDQRGILTRIVSEAPLDAIQDVSWSRKGILQTIFRLGDLKVQTAGATANIEAKSIPHPEAVHELINDMRHTQPAKKAEASPVVSPSPTVPATQAEKLKAICAMLEKYSAEELTRIETILKARERSSIADAFLGDENKDA